MSPASFDAPTMLDDVEKGEPPRLDVTRSPAIRVVDLSVRFGEIVALDGVSFDVPAGSVTGLIGRNGAGKSTCIRCLAGLLRPGSGAPIAGASLPAVTIMGVSPIEEITVVVAATGFLLSEPALFPYLTPAETLEWIGRAFGLSPAEARLRTDDLLTFFELVGAADRYVDDFSTGMKKRLALAAALIHSPSVLVLDEPFESLDPLMVRSLKRLLVDYAVGGGTILLSSHLIDAVEEICDRVVILEAGRCVAAGTTEEVKASIADRLPEATLEDLYATLVPERRERGMNWLVRGGG